LIFTAFAELVAHAAALWVALDTTCLIVWAAWCCEFAKTGLVTLGRLCHMCWVSTM